MLPNLCYSQVYSVVLGQNGLCQGLSYSNFEHNSILLQWHTLYRTKGWWENVVLLTFTDYDWLQNFRMKRSTFEYLCAQLQPVIQRHNTHLRRAISVRHRVAVTLWCLAAPAEYRTISHLFGIGKSTVCEIVHETVDAIITRLKQDYIRFPTGQAQRDVINGFESTWGFPQCVGALDGCHIPLRPPSLAHTDYYNRKGWLVFNHSSSSGGSRIPFSQYQCGVAR